MFPWQEILQIIVQNTVAAYSQTMFWVVMGIIAYQYWRLQKQQIKMFGVSGQSLQQQVILAVVFGTVGGVLASFLLSLVGVTLNRLGLAYIWPVAIILMAVNMRFMCFAYAGGLVAAANVLFGWPDVNVPQVLSLVAILHVTESMLIFISGRYGATPLILQRDDGRLVGAFNLQNFWPLPLVLMIAVMIPDASLPTEIINTPDWWPLLPMEQTPPEGHQWLYSMLPAVAALGYADIAVSSTPSVRRRQSALHLSLYSIVLLVLAIASARYSWLQFIAALASPLGHELLIQLDNKREMEGEPRFVPPARGVMVLETLWGTPSFKLGLRPGDILLDLDGTKIDSGFDLARAISFASREFAVSFSREGRLFTRKGKFSKGERRLGIMLVPEGYEQHYVHISRERYGLVEWLKRLLRR
jgi:uncharacterized membrane protein YwzB